MSQQNNETSSISDLFDELCVRHGRLTLARSNATGASFRFAELPSFSNTLLACLADSTKPLTTGRVALVVKSPYLFTLLYLSLFRLDLTIIPINPILPQESIARILTSANIDRVISDVQVKFDTSRVLLLSETSMSEIAERSDSSAQELSWPREPSVILFTSGTTSVPKGVILRHHSLIANAQHIAEHLGVKRSRLLGVLPLHFTNGQVFNILIPFLTGSTIYCNSEYSMMSLGAFWSSIADHRIEYVDVVPTVLSALLALPPSRQPDVSSLKYLICGGAAISVEMLREFQDRFGVSILQEYGLTEATCVSAMEGPGARHLGTVGVPLKGNIIEIRNEDRSPCRAGERGEIYISGEYLMKGYLNATDATSIVDSEGWLATGDLGIMDDEGYLSIAGRRKTVIIKGGETIVPEDIESVAYRSAWVRDAVASGVADPFYGEVIELSVVWTDGVPHEPELTEILRLELPRAWWPKRIISIDTVPRTASGKILRDQAG